jgi:tetratricopeptide (TPR) repeat protein
MTRTVKAGEELELAVADAYRQMGAWKVEHDVDLAGNQIDVYAELTTTGRSLHRIAVEVKDWQSTVGIDVVNRFAHVVELLRNERLVDEGIIVSTTGFSRPARNAAQSYGVRLLELADLEAMITQVESSGWVQPSAPTPVPPKPYYAHPYPMQENFTGRVRERQMLTRWFVEERRPVLTLTAMGGMGKSALAWVWLLRDVLDQPLSGLADDSPGARKSCRVPPKHRPEGVLWWSFYEAEAKFDVFLDRALAYTSSGQVDPETISSTHDKVRALINLLQEHHFLIVLDGFEWELRGYASLSAAYQGDAVPEDSQENYRACTDVHAANFLRWAAALTLQSRILLTSRLSPVELDNLAGCWRVDLTALDPEDAVSFFRAQGIQGTRAEILAACKPCGYHPLTLRLLTGMIAKDPSQPGDVAAVANYDLVNDVVPKERRILALAYDALNPGLQELLSRLAAFRSPVGYEVAALLSPFRSKRDLGLAFSELADRGLIYFDREWWRYDLHPIVRAYAYDRLGDKEGIHNRLREYFAAAPIQEVDRINAMEDLVPLIELYHHTVHAGRYDEAAELFHDHLADPLYYRFGAYRTEIDLLRALFPQDRDPSKFQWSAESLGSNGVGLPRLRAPSAQAWTLNALASSYTCAGQASYAVPLLKVHNALQKKLGDAASLAVGLENLAGVQLELGELAEAERNLRHSVKWGKESGQRSIEASGRTDLGRLLAYEGAFEEASRELDAAMDIQREIGHVQSQVLSWIYRAQLALLRGQPQVVLDAARSALQLAEAMTDASQSAYTARGYVWAFWLLGAAYHALGVPIDAEVHLSAALGRCRQINLVELEPDILLSWAHWHQADGDREQALECAEEALSIANRSEYRLKQSEINNFLAQWALDLGEVVKAREHAEMAKAFAWCDGPPHCYKPALDEAEGLLELVIQPASIAD